GATRRGATRSRGEGECNVDTPGGRTRLASTARYDHVLATVCFVHRRRGVARKRKRRLPQNLSATLVEGPELVVEVRSADEQQTSSSHHAAAVVLASGRLHSPSDKRRILAKRNLPDDLASLQIYRIERSPRRRDRGVAVLIEKAIVTGDRVFQIDRRRRRGHRHQSVFASDHIPNKRANCFVPKPGETRHASESALDHCLYFRLASPGCDSDKRREFRRRPGQVALVTSRAFAEVEILRDRDL